MGGPIQREKVHTLLWTRIRILDTLFLLAQTQPILDPPFCLYLVVNAITWAIQGASLHLSLVVKMNACHSSTKRRGVVMLLLATQVRG
jgi:hypothetical protein